MTNLYVIMSKQHVIIEGESMDMHELKEGLLELLRAKGAALIGVADLTGIPGAALKTGISVAVPVPCHIVEIGRAHV